MQNLIAGAWRAGEGTPDLIDEACAAAAAAFESFGSTDPTTRADFLETVSYTHLTLPTIYAV